VSKNANLVLRCHLSEAFSGLLVSHCIWLARLTFELTNQDSEGEKNCTVLALMQLFSFETARNIHEKGLIISKTISDCKNWKLQNILSLQSFNFAPKMGRPCPATHSWFVSVARCYFQFF